MSLRSLTCQGCGAALPAPVQQDPVKCEFCGAELIVLVAERIEVHQATPIPEAILLAEPLPARPAVHAPPPAPAPVPERSERGDFSRGISSNADRGPRDSRSQSEIPDIPPWAERLFFRAIREIFRWRR
jgi:hypothetical protein